MLFLRYIVLLHTTYIRSNCHWYLLGSIYIMSMCYVAMFMCFETAVVCVYVCMCVCVCVCVVIVIIFIVVVVVVVVFFFLLLPPSSSLFSVFGTVFSISSPPATYIYLPEGLSHTHTHTHTHVYVHWLILTRWRCILEKN